MTKILFLSALLVGSLTGCKREGSGAESGTSPVALTRVSGEGDAAALVPWSETDIDFTQFNLAMSLDYNSIDEKAKDTAPAGSAVIAYCLEKLDPEMVVGVLKCDNAEIPIKAKNIVQACQIPPASRVEPTEFLNCNSGKAWHYRFAPQVGFGLERKDNLSL
jgi:hypothetical protein